MLTRVPCFGVLFGDPVFTSFIPIRGLISCRCEMNHVIPAQAGLTGRGGEGMVVKPSEWIMRGKKGLERVEALLYLLIRTNLPGPVFLNRAALALVLHSRWIAE